MPSATVTKSILENAWLQGGAVLLLVTLLVLALISTFYFVVKPLWEDNKALREKVMQMTERVILTSELSRQANETSARALTEQSVNMRDAIAWLRAVGPRP